MDAAPGEDGEAPAAVHPAPPPPFHAEPSVPPAGSFGAIRSTTTTEERPVFAAIPAARGDRVVRPCHSSCALSPGDSERTSRFGERIASRPRVVRLALAVFGQEISPRFCHAREVVIVDWEGADLVHRAVLHLGGVPYPARLEGLAAFGVEWLICGSFPRERRAEALLRYGIRVVCGVAGPVPESAEALAQLASGAEGAGPLLRARLEEPPRGCPSNARGSS